MRLLPRQRRKPVRNRGAFTVEVAICIPIAFLVIFGIVEFARVGQVSNAAAFASYQGCRRGIVTGATATDVKSAAQAVLDSMSIPKATIIVTPSVITKSTTAVTVIVSVPMNSASWIAPVYTKDFTISKGCSMTCQGAIPANVAVPTLPAVVEPAPLPPENPPTSITDTTGTTSTGSTSTGTTGADTTGTGTTGTSTTGTATTDSGTTSTGTRSTSTTGSGTTSTGTTGTWKTGGGKTTTGKLSTSKTSSTSTSSTTTGTSGTSSTGSSSTSSGSGSPTLLH